MAEFDQYRTVYEDEINQAISFAGKTHEFYTKVKADYLIDLIGMTATQSAVKVLDVGCGNGSIHQFLLSSRLALDLTGVEVADQFLEAARAAFPNVKYDVYDGERLPYDDRTFDFVFTICVMHHVPPHQWQRFLMELQRVVRPGGTVAIFEHNPINPVTAHIVRTCPLDQNAVLLSAPKLSRLMKASGYVTVQSKYLLFTPFDNALVRRAEHYLRWLPLGAQYACTGQRPDHDASTAMPPAGRRAGFFL